MSETTVSDFLDAVQKAHRTYAAGDIDQLLAHNARGAWKEGQAAYIRKQAFQSQDEEETGYLLRDAARREMLARIAKAEEGKLPTSTKPLPRA